MSLDLSQEFYKFRTYPCLVLTVLDLPSVDVVDDVVYHIGLVAVVIQSDPASPRLLHVSGQHCGEKWRPNAEIVLMGLDFLILGDDDDIGRVSSLQEFLVVIIRVRHCYLFVVTKI